jgi:hypothetical protein
VEQTELIVFFTRKFHDTSVTRSRTGGKARIGSTVTGSSSFEVAEPRHAHELWLAIHFGGAGAAFSRFAVPAHRQITRLLGLNLVDRIQHDHPFRHLGGVRNEAPAARISTPNLERSLRATRRRLHIRH